MRSAQSKRPKYKYFCRLLYFWIGRRIRPFVISGEGRRDTIRSASALLPHYGTTLDSAQMIFVGNTTVFRSRRFWVVDSAPVLETSHNHSAINDHSGGAYPFFSAKYHHRKTFFSGFWWYFLSVAQNPKPYYTVPMNTITHPFPPLYDSGSKVLILGSFPSVKSREQQFYYGHPQNRFWKLMALIFSGPEAAPPRSKRSYATARSPSSFTKNTSCP